MKGAELLETYPKAAKVISEFYNNKLIDSMNDSSEGVSEEFKEMIKQQSFDNEYVATFIDSNPRFLFDVFDDNELYIGIIPTYTNDGVVFQYTLTTLISGEQPTRIEAEKAVIELAFKMLNDKL
jgi:hypothetical protein